MKSHISVGDVLLLHFSAFLFIGTPLRSAPVFIVTSNISFLGSFKMWKSIRDSWEETQEICDQFSSYGKPGSWFTLAKCMKWNRGRVTFYIKIQVNYLHVYLKGHSSTGLFHTLYWLKSSIWLLHNSSHRDQIMPRWGRVSVINAFSSNLNTVNLHLKIKHDHSWPFYKIMKGFILKVNC